MEMKKWHFDHTKSYIEALDVGYVKIEELEAEKDDTKRDEGKEGDAREKKMKEKQKEVVDISWRWSFTHKCVVEERDCWSSCTK